MAASCPGLSFHPILHWQHLRQPLSLRFRSLACLSMCFCNLVWNYTLFGAMIVSVTFSHWVMSYAPFHCSCIFLSFVYRFIFFFLAMGGKHGGSFWFSKKDAVRVADSKRPIRFTCTRVIYSDWAIHYRYAGGRGSAKVTRVDPEGGELSPAFGVKDEH